MLGTEFQDMLRCIRCGACMNHCPVYHAVGGHAYGWVYPGPMGAVLTPSLIGVDYLNTSKTWDPNSVDKTNGFLNDLEKSTPNTDYASKQNERQYFDDMRQKKGNGSGSGGSVQNDIRNQYIQQSNNSSRFNIQERDNIPHQKSGGGNINFTDPNFGLAGQLGNNSNNSNNSNKVIIQLKVKKWI